MNNIIEIKNLCRSFGNIKAVDDISFSVKEGELFAFLGVNGAGKSTTINIICGSLKKDCGQVLIDSTDIDIDSGKIKRELGVVFQNSLLDKALSVKDNLKYRAALYGITDSDFDSRLSYLAKLLDFEDILSRTVSKLSGGQRRRIDIARALLNNPRILILDEPTTGLDPQTRQLLWKVISDLRKTEKLTVFLTTHYMEEAADADRVVILDSGRISAEGTPLELKNQFAEDYIVLYDVSEEEIKKLGIPAVKVNSGWRACVKSTAEATDIIVAHPEIFRDYEITKGNMDDIFLAVTGKKLLGEESK